MILIVTYPSNTANTCNVYMYVVEIIVDVYVFATFHFSSTNYGETFSKINGRLESGTLRLYRNIIISPEDYKTVIIISNYLIFLYF